MTRVQKAQLRQSELRSKIAAELDKEEADRDSGELERLTKEAQAVEVELRAALVIEEENAIPDVVQTQEDYQLTELRSRVSFGPYLKAAMAGVGVNSGAEAEYNAELGLPAEYFPVELLAGNGAVETRAKRDGDASASQGDWLDRVFSDTAAMRLGVSFRNVNPGVQAYPITAAGGEPVQRGREEAVGESTYTMNVTEIKPSRASVHGVYNIEDDLRVPGLADSIQRDMTLAMTEKIDRVCFVGDSGADEAGADVTGLQTASITEVEISQTNKVLPSQTLSAFTSMIDGQYATMLQDLRVVAAVGAYRLWETTVANAQAENQTVGQFMRTAGLNWTARGGIESATADGDFAAFVGRARGIDGSAIAAVWNQGQLVRDPYSGAKKGEVELTLNYFWQFAIVRAANFQRVKFGS